VQGGASGTMVALGLWKPAAYLFAADVHYRLLLLDLGDGGL
jgi:hypothetical protein